MPISSGRFVEILAELLQNGIYLHRSCLPDSREPMRPVALTLLSASRDGSFPRALFCMPKTINGKYKRNFCSDNESIMC